MKHPPSKAAGKVAAEPRDGATPNTTTSFLWPERYTAAPDPSPLPPPGTRPTSRAAAAAVRTRAPIQRERILDFIRRNGPHGATDHEVCAALALQLQSVSPRRGEMVKDAQVFDSGRTRATPSGNQATVWITPEHTPGGAA